MTKTKRWFIAAGALSLWPVLAWAATPERLTLKTTEDLYRVCSSRPDDPLHVQEINLCQGFLLGVVSYHDAISDRRHLPRLICYPPTATRDEGIEAFVDWAANHQQDQKFMADPAVVGAVRGLAAKWPCEHSNVKGQ
ncbi:MAG TPA: Rap1a/Tai family immunity protein [Stellaceae bacterium]|nr:Rap1a/Tai family immunity protein [Stellaceae bacterium]